MNAEPRNARRAWLRRQAARGLNAALAAGVGDAWAQGAAAQGSAPAPPASGPLLSRAIPASGERVPLVGLGTWITFNVGRDARALEGVTDVVRAFFAQGGRLIDSSPMYGSSQPAIGHALARLNQPGTLFSAEKVWTGDGSGAAAQIEASRAFWGVRRFDLMQVHNLLAWEQHLPRLLALKAEGRLRYVGITTSEGRRHAEIERIMRTQPIDFVQVTYNPADREAEARILPLAAERRIAVLANRPFREGALLRALVRQALPGWARELGCDSWAQAVLKFVVSHPAVTTAIPATSQVAHVVQNLGAARGALPDAALRARIVADVAARV